MLVLQPRDDSIPMTRLPRTVTCGLESAGAAGLVPPVRAWRDAVVPAA
jgi:hypothetical protein